MFTEAEGIKLLEYAGFKVELKEYGFYIFENEKKLYYSSTKKALQDPKFLMKHFIQENSFKKGFKKGQETIKKQFHELFKIN